jgi:hypothetical protein
MNTAIVAANILQKHGLSGGAGGGVIPPPVPENALQTDDLKLITTDDGNQLTTD